MKHSTTRNIKKKKKGQSPSKNDLLIATLSQRLSNYYGIVKTGVRKRKSPGSFLGTVLAQLGRFEVPFWRPFGFEGGPKIRPFAKINIK